MKYKPELGLKGNIERLMGILSRTNIAAVETNSKVTMVGVRVDETAETLKTQLAESDEIAIELYEANLAQEAINAEQDEAIIEIYEMMEGTNNG